MQQSNYRAEFDAALSKAFAARSPEVRNAYLELATFYRRKLEEASELHPHTSNDRT